MNEHPNFLEFSVCDTCAAETMCHEVGPNEHQCGGCYWAPINEANHQSELAALREELARKDRVIEDMLESNCDMTTCLAAAEQRNAEFEKGRDAAEDRTAEISAQLQLACKYLLQSKAALNQTGPLARNISKFIKGYIQPTESGASE